MFNYQYFWLYLVRTLYQQLNIFCSLKLSDFQHYYFPQLFVGRRIKFLGVMHEPERGRGIFFFFKVTI